MTTAQTSSLTPEKVVDLVAWIEHEFYIEELAAPIVLADYQRACLREALRRNSNGKFVYDLVLWSDIKKSAKSVIAAAVLLARAFHKPYGTFRVVANDQKQAMSRVFEYMKICLRMNPRLRGRADVNRLLITLDNGAKIEAVAVDPKGEAGGADDMVEFTELHAANNKAASAMWTEMTLSPLKHGYSQRWVDTYAGFSGESPLLEALYASGVTEGSKLQLPDSGSDDLEVYANLRQFTLWNTKPRLYWQTDDYYAEESRILIPAQFARIHRNQWVASTNTFVPIEWWDACRVDELPAIGAYREVIIALDAAVSDDCFGFIAVSMSDNKTIVRGARRWLPVDGRILYSDPEDPTNREYPEGELRWWVENYNVVLCAYDLTQLHHFVTMLQEEGLCNFEKFDQGAPRLRADKMLYDCIRERQIVHDGNVDLRQHVQNANSTADDKDTLRIIKRKHELKIDMCVALSMANERCRQYLQE